MPTSIESRGYQTGFGNEFATEAVAGALPVGRNSPQRVAHGLYAEQLSGTAFTAPRGSNRRSWVYRIRPAVTHGEFHPYVQPHLHSDFAHGAVSPNQLRWDPLPLPTTPTDFVDGLYTMGGNGSPDAHGGVGIHLYAATADMQGRYFYDADGELLIVPQLGRLRLLTEFGVIEIEPQQVAVIPRGVRFRVELPDGQARGYICENFGALLRLPDLGPIGSNGLANPRDFETPNAAFEDVDGAFELIAKFQGQLWRADIDHSPLDVVAWHGNYAPYRLRPAPFQHDRLDQPRPPGPLHFPGAALAQRHAGHQQHGLRDLPAALAGGPGHVPSAVVPPQYRQRVHGPDPRCL